MNRKFGQPRTSTHSAYYFGSSLVSHSTSSSGSRVIVNTTIVQGRSTFRKSSFQTNDGFSRLLKDQYRQDRRNDCDDRFLSVRVFKFPLSLLISFRCVPSCTPYYRRGSTKNHREDHRRYMKWLWLSSNWHFHKVIGGLEQKWLCIKNFSWILNNQRIEFEFVNWVTL